jgi:glutamine phosphoribosylpyrophosphate amidotransferase
VVYQTIEGLKSAISISSNSKVKNPCMACLNGKYPTEVSEAKRFVELRKQERAGHS